MLLNFHVDAINHVILRKTNKACYIETSYDETYPIST